MDRINSGFSPLESVGYNQDQIEEARKNMDPSMAKSIFNPNIPTRGDFNKGYDLAMNNALAMGSTAPKLRWNGSQWVDISGSGSSIPDHWCAVLI